MSEYETVWQRIQREPRIRPIDDVDRAKWRGQEKHMLRHSDYYDLHGATTIAQLAQRIMPPNSVHTMQGARVALEAVHEIVTNIVGDSIIEELGLDDCRFDGTDLEETDTGGGCVAWLLKEPEVRGLHALLTCESVYCPRPDKPVEIGVYEDGESQELTFVEFANPEAMRDWYEKQVGHRLEGERFAGMCAMVAGTMLYATRDARAEKAAADATARADADQPNVFFADKRRWCCAWGVGYQPGARIVDVTFFTEDNGFTAEDRQDIMELGIGCTHAITGMVEMMFTTYLGECAEPAAEAEASALQPAEWRQRLIRVLERCKPHVPGSLFDEAMDVLHSIPVIAEERARACMAACEGEQDLHAGELGRLRDRHALDEANRVPAQSTPPSA